METVGNKLGDLPVNWPTLLERFKNGFISSFRCVYVWNVILHHLRYKLIRCFFINSVLDQFNAIVSTKTIVNKADNYLAAKTCKLESVKNLAECLDDCQWNVKVYSCSDYEFTATLELTMLSCIAYRSV